MKRDIDMKENLRPENLKRLEAIEKCSRLATWSVIEEGFHYF